MPKPPILLRIFGYYRIKTDVKYLTRLQNLFFALGVIAYPDGENGFYIKAREKQKVLERAKKERLSISIGPLLGLFHRVRVHRYRIGMPVGVALAVLILFFGTSSVWHLEISGNQKLSSSEITEALSALGFGVGARTNRENYDDIITAYRLEHPEVAWMGIYTNGTTAHIRIIENTLRDDPPEVSGASSLVATDDAVILRLDVAHGTAVVKPGSVVKKGDALVLGHIPGAHYDALLSAEGKVFGRVSEKISVEIPYLQSEKIEKNKKTLGLDLFFFEKIINIFKKTSKSPEDYVIIERKEVLTIGERTLPFGFLIREAVYYEELERSLSRSEAISDGEALLEQKIRSAVGDGELLWRHVQIEEKEDACILHATIEYTKNIAEQQPFTAG